MYVHMKILRSYAYTCTRIHMYICIQTVCMSACMNMNKYVAFACACVCVRVCVYVCACVLACACVHACQRMQVRTHYSMSVGMHIYTLTQP